MDYQIISILIRTHNRPTLFARALKSVTDQNYPNLRVIVSTDCNNNYIPEWCDKIHVKPGNEQYPYDVYNNYLKELVTDGWFMYLDDDDYMLPGVLEQAELTHPVIIHRLNHMGNIIPKGNGLQLGQIGMPCFMIHNSLKDAAHFSGQDHGDYWFAKELSHHVEFHYSDLIFVESDRKGNGK